MVTEANMLLITIQREKCFQAQRIVINFDWWFQEKFSDMTIAGLGVVSILPTERMECDLVEVLINGNLLYWERKIH